MCLRGFYINGLVQERLNPLLTHWSYVFLPLTHRYYIKDLSHKICCVTTCGCLRASLSTTNRTISSTSRHSVDLLMSYQVGTQCTFHRWIHFHWQRSLDVITVSKQLCYWRCYKRRLKCVISWKNLRLIGKSSIWTLHMSDENILYHLSISSHVIVP